MLIPPSLLFILSFVVWCRCGVCVLTLPFNSLLNSPLKETSPHCRGNMASCCKLLLEILWMMIRNLKDSDSTFSNAFQGITLQRKTLASDCSSRTQVRLLGRSGRGVSRVPLNESCWQSQLQRYCFVCRETAPCQRELHSALAYRVLLKLKRRVQSCAGVEDYTDQSFCYFMPWLSRPTPKHENHLCGSHYIYQTSRKLIAILLPHLCAMRCCPQMWTSVSWFILLGLCSVVFVESFLGFREEGYKEQSRLGGFMSALIDADTKKTPSC